VVIPSRRARSSDLRVRRMLRLETLPCALRTRDSPAKRSGGVELPSVAEASAFIQLRPRGAADGTARLGESEFSNKGVSKGFANTIPRDSRVDVGGSQIYEWAESVDREA